MDMNYFQEYNALPAFAQGAASAASWGGHFHSETKSTETEPGHLKSGGTEIASASQSDSPRDED